MTPKEELRGIFYKDKEIIILEEQIEETRAKLERVTPVLTNNPCGGGSTDRMTDGVAKLIELKEMLSRKIDEICEYRMECLSKIDRIPDGRYRVILKERYFNNKSFEEISVIVNYAYNRTCMLHGKALKAYDEVDKKC